MVPQHAQNQDVDGCECLHASHHHRKCGRTGVCKKKRSKMGFSMFKSRFLAIEREFPLGLSDLTGDHVGLSHHMIGFQIKIRISQIHASKQGPNLPG
jgi:hypothetical protein